MEIIKRIVRGRGIRSRVTQFTLLLLACLITGYMVVFYVTVRLSGNIHQMFKESLLLEDVSKTMDIFEDNLEDYLNTKDTDSFIAYQQKYVKLETLSKKLNQGLSYRQEVLLQNNISHILDRYLRVANQAVDYKRGRNTPEYIQAFNDVQRYSGYISDMMELIRTSEFSANLEDYIRLSEKIQALKWVFIAMTGVLIALSMVFIWDFTKRLAEPIERLSDYAAEISKGNYESSLKPLGAYREAEQLSSTLSEMASSIARYINVLRDTAEMENKLQLSEIENLKMQNLLKNAELTALQAQINPHFLFNTLNAGLQLANLEDAERTGEFLESLSTLFRYNIQSLENIVSLRDEISNVGSYYKLMKVRFDEMICLEMDVDESVLGISMPPLILQPIIENALIHGFKDREYPGCIQIIVRKISEGAAVTIRDNGHGIEEEKIRALMESGFTSPRCNNRAGHTTGLGMGNVYDRLRYFYGQERVLSIRSVKEQFTEIQIILYSTGRLV